MTKAKSHLLKHEVPESVDLVVHFGTDDKKEIARLVTAMGQRQLQVRPWEVSKLVADSTHARGCEGGFLAQPPCEGGMQTVPDGGDLLA